MTNAPLGVTKVLVGVTHVPFEATKMPLEATMRLLLVRDTSRVTCTRRDADQGRSPLLV